MFLILTLFSFGILLIHPCLSILVNNRPPLKWDTLIYFTTLLVYLYLADILIIALSLFIKVYGSSYGGIYIGPIYSYLTALFILIVILLIIRSSIYHSKIISTSRAVAGIYKSHALPSLYKTLQRMELRYQEDISQIKLLDLNIDIETELSDHEIRFRVTSPIDKIFLNRLCRSYQEQYQADGAPLVKGNTIIAALVGLLCEAGAIFLLVDWMMVKCSSFLS
jgi:ABC-type multidrug transport system fused ATPase/permease subunit